MAKRKQPKPEPKPITDPRERDAVKGWGAYFASTQMELALKMMRRLGENIEHSLRKYSIQLDGKADEPAIREAMIKVWEAMELFARNESRAKQVRLKPSEKQVARQKVAAHR